MKYLLVEILPQAGVVSVTLCEADQSVLAEFASPCCPKCAIEGCLQAAAIDDLLADQEQIEIRELDPNQDE